MINCGMKRYFLLGCVSFWFRVRKELDPEEEVGSETIRRNTELFHIEKFLLFFAA